MQAAQLSSRSVFVYFLLFEVKISVTGQNCSKPGRPASLFKSLYLSQGCLLLAVTTHFCLTRGSKRSPVWDWSERHLTVIRTPSDCTLRLYLAMLLWVSIDSQYSSQQLTIACSLIHQSNQPILIFSRIRVPNLDRLKKETWLHSFVCVHCFLALARDH